MANKLTDEEQETWDILNTRLPESVGFSNGGSRYNMPASMPLNPSIGDTYFDLDNNLPYLFNGTDWVPMIH